jgi:hypothetical protein
MFLVIFLEPTHLLNGTGIKITDKLCKNWDDGEKLQLIPVIVALSFEVTTNSELVTTEPFLVEEI